VDLVCMQTRGMHVNYFSDLLLVEKVGRFQWTLDGRTMLGSASGVRRNGGQARVRVGSRVIHIVQSI